MLKFFQYLVIWLSILKKEKAKSFSHKNYSNIEIRFGRFLNYFPRENIHIIDGDNLIKQNPYIQLSKIEKFLNLSSHFDRSQFTFVPEKGFYCTARKTNGPSCASKSKGRKHVAVNEKTKEKLRQFLVEPNLEFFQLSGMNFSWNDSL